MHNRKQTPNSNSFVRSEKSTFLGEKTPTSVLSSLRATPISARTVSLSQKNSSHIYSREKQPNCQQGKRSFHNHHTANRGKDRFTIIIIIISGFGIYGAVVVPDSGVGNTWQRLTLVLHEFLSDGLTPSRLHIVISFLTHADHVFLGLPRSLVPGSPKRVMELMHEMARCTCPYHLRRRVRRTAVISSISSFWRSTRPK